MMARQVISPDGEVSWASAKAVKSLLEKGWTLVGVAPDPEPAGKADKPKGKAKSKGKAKAEPEPEPESEDTPDAEPAEK